MSLVQPILRPLCGPVLRSPFDAVGGAASMPTGALGIWYADEYVSSPRGHIPNSVSTVAVSPDLGLGSRRLFGTILYQRSGVTVVDANANDRDGVANQASTITGTGNWFIGPAQSPVQAVFTAGTYGFAFDYRRSGGADQSIKACWDFSGGSTLTATAAWQRSPVISASLSAAQHQAVIKSIDGSTGATFELCNFHTFAGTTDPWPTGETLAGHLYMGWNSSATVPTATSGLVDYSTQGIALAQFPTTQTLTAFTMVQSASRVSTLANYQALLSKVQAYANFTPYLEIDGYPRLGLGGSDRGTQGAGLWALTSSGLHVLMTVYDGTDIRFYIDNILVCPPVVVSSSGSFTDLWNFVNGSSQYAGYKWNAMALYDRALTSTERSAAYSALVTRAARTSNTITQPTRIYFAEGDSITAFTGSGVGGSYAYKYGQNAVAGTRGGVLAAGGATLNNNAGNSLIERATATDAYLVSGKTNILSVLIGANDLYHYTGGGAQYATDVAVYCDARRAAGWKVVIGTVLPRSDVSLTAGEITTHNTERAIYNTAVRGWVGTHCDGVMDFAADATMGPDAASNNATYYSDKIHPTLAGQVILEGIARPVINAL